MTNQLGRRATGARTRHDRQRASAARNRSTTGLASKAAVAGALALFLAACGGGDTEDSGSGDTTVIPVGVTNSTAEAPLLIADEMGYFEEEGVEVELVPFKSGGDMVAALGNGDLDVGLGGPSGGLFNALGRDLDLRIVADNAHILEDASYLSLMVRSDLIESGEFQSYEDLEGLQVADYQEAGTTSAALNRMLESAGMTIDDIERTFLPGPEQRVAFENGGIDAALTAEPLVTAIEEDGSAVRFAGSHETYPGQQVSVMMYSDNFASDRPDDAAAFMRAYLRAAATFTDAVEGGALTGPQSEEIIGLLADHTGVDAEILGQVSMHGINEDGSINVEGLESDLEFWRSGGWAEENDVTAASAVDMSFADAAYEELSSSEE